MVFFLLIINCYGNFWFEGNFFFGNICIVFEVILWNLFIMYLDKFFLDFDKLDFNERFNFLNC